MKWTHTGRVVGCDARTAPGYSRRVQLRETKTLWVSSCGLRFSKKWDGAEPGRWPRTRLDLSTVQPIPEPVQ